MVCAIDGMMYGELWISAESDAPELTMQQVTGGHDRLPIAADQRRDEYWQGHLVDLVL